MCRSSRNPPTSVHNLSDDQVQHLNSLGFNTLGDMWDIDQDGVADFDAVQGFFDQMAAAIPTLAYSNNMFNLVIPGQHQQDVIDELVNGFTVEASNCLNAIANVVIGNQLSLPAGVSVEITDQSQMDDQLVLDDALLGISVVADLDPIYLQPLSASGDVGFDLDLQREEEGEIKVKIKDYKLKMGHKVRVTETGIKEGTITGSGPVKVEVEQDGKKTCVTVEVDFEYDLKKMDFTKFDMTIKC